MKLQWLDIQIYPRIKLQMKFFSNGPSEPFNSFLELRSCGSCKTSAKEHAGTTFLIRTERASLTAHDSTAQSRFKDFVFHPQQIARAEISRQIYDQWMCRPLDLDPVKHTGGWNVPGTDGGR